MTIVSNIIKLCYFKQKITNLNCFIAEIILDLYRLECKLTEYSILKRNPPSFRIGEIVAVLIVEWEKWVRARIELESNDGQQFLLWTIDYGLPVVASSKIIVALPDKLANDPLEVVFLGGIGNCVPSDMQYDVNERRAKSTPRQKWSAKAIESVGNILRNAAAIEFTPKILQFKGHHNFGELFVYSIAKHRVDVVQMLYDLSEAMHSSDFINDLNEIETLKHEPWLTADGKIRISKNIFTTCTNSAGVPIEFKLTSEGETENIGTRYEDSEHLGFQNFHGNDDIASVCNTELNEFFDSSASVIGNSEYQQTKSSVQNRLMQSNTHGFDGDIDSEVTINQQNMSCKAGREMQQITIPRKLNTPIETVSNPSNSLRSIGNNNRSLREVAVERSPPLGRVSYTDREAFLKNRMRAESSNSVVPATVAGYGRENVNSQMAARNSISVMPSTFGGFGRENVPNPNHMEAARLATNLLKGLNLSDQYLNGNRSDELKVNRGNNFDHHWNARSGIQHHRDAPRNQNGAISPADRRNDNRGQRQTSNNGQSNTNLNGRSRNTGAINDRLNK